MPHRLTRPILAAALTLIAQIGLAQAPPPSAPTQVTADNFIQAESDLYFAAIVQRGGYGRFFHDREPAAVGGEGIIPLDPDTVYSSAGFGPHGGAVTIPLANPGSRFLAMQVISQDHYTTAVHYG